MRSQLHSRQIWARVQRVMRVIALGTAATLLAYIVHQWSDGLLSAAALLLTWFMATVTVGGAVAAAVNTSQRYSPVPRSVGSRNSSGCTWCGSPFISLSDTNVCSICDCLPLDQRSRRQVWT